MRLIDADALIGKCGEWYTEEGCEEGCVGTLKHLLNKQPTIEPKDEWIPCSERLPKLGEKVLVYTSKTCFTQVFKGIYSDPTRWHWENNSLKKVVAWMPLPKPWEGADDE